VRDVWIVTVSSAIGVRIVMENESGLGKGAAAGRKKRLGLWKKD
jgi:hypothetical protein